MLKKVVSLVLVVALLSVSSFSFAFAANNSDNNKIIVKISDSETGHVWKWEIPESEIKLTTSKIDNSKISAFSSSLNNMNGEIVQKSANIHLGKYLNQTLSSIIDGSTTKNDDIILTTGLSYSANALNNTVSIYAVFGSTTPQGMYYAGNRVVYWRNPGAGLGGKFYPTSDSWHYSTDSTPGAYRSDVPPYSILDCRIYVYGMTAYRDVSVEFDLTNP
ncbi:hypothetical protein [Thermoanaerobacterium sp. RBIITD]|uniref:hypothetical protein n=1 Tax=Thermoanaerobacterium sp. RBIITD TaxID=1550240 RepID=UPI000BB86F1A|nr:hypothetical protein [Thermoanaerobacterium sp. RBIITD]SNX52606.1 hypothetical protein SAMN05660242_0008 [Thermoanaerobacterium sp. RBIITD]